MSPFFFGKWEDSIMSRRQLLAAFKGEEKRKVSRPSPQPFNEGKKVREKDLSMKGETSFL